MRTSCDVLIAGGGIVGLATALQLAGAGMRIAVVERREAMRAASYAAAGMLAAGDPENPRELGGLARLSAELYPQFLARIERLSGIPVPFRTQLTLQAVSSNGPRGVANISSESVAHNAPGLDITARAWLPLPERSLDPRELCRALPKAAVAAGVLLLEHTTLSGLREHRTGVLAQTSAGEIAANHFINAAGAWAADIHQELPVVPRKGQMATLQLPPEALRCVVRTADVYLVPRGDGRVLVGATVEHAGFDTATQPDVIQSLIRRAAAVLPAIAGAAQLDAWAGIRPGTPDGLPLIGQLGTRSWAAVGHFRNGILLAPATALVLAQLLAGQSPSVPLEQLSPSRFSAAPALR